jgi:dipeptidase D
MYVDGDWVRANGTTLGADNGLGVATIMAVLDSDNIAHPTIEALFTVDEETGMTGAIGLKGGLLEGEILLNLDTEDDDEIGVGCAGGVDVTASGSYHQIPAPKGQGYRITIKGLQGGHSGMDISKGLGNANKMMNRLLAANKNIAHIASVAGGSLRNAIPRESNATVVVATQDISEFVLQMEKLQFNLVEEYRLLEPDLTIETQKIDPPQMVMSSKDQTTFINAVYASHNGVYRMSPAIEGLVETSNNIAKISIANATLKIECLTRSSVDSSKDDMAATLTSVFELAGYTVQCSGHYPGWAPNMDSAILKVVESLYISLHGEKPNVAACHAGLECGILGQNYPKMDMISFGPTIKGAHSPDERASISSAQKYWKFVLEILKNIPLK